MGNKNTNNIIWIDPNIDNKENQYYSKHLKSISNTKFQGYKNINNAIDYLKSIKFEETKIIVSGKLYFDFINTFKSKLQNIYVIPKIIIFTSNKEKFINYNKNNKDNLYIINHPFYNYGGIKTSFDDILKFVKNKIIINSKEETKLLTEYKNVDSYIIYEYLKQDSELEQLTFEYINEKDKLILPLLYKVLINQDKIDDNIEEYTTLLYNNYTNKNIKLKKLLGSIKSMSNIPIELLAKYYIRAYTAESNLYRDINKDLREKKIKNHLSFVKILYEGIKLKSFPLGSNKTLYRGSKISKIEIQKINEYLNKKKENLPAAIVYSRTFLSFSKEIKIAQYFLKYKNKDTNLSKIFFVLEKDDSMDYNLSIHGDIENMSFIVEEKEVLFFPFSSFEIKNIEEMEMEMEKEKEKEKIYKINLLYLGKYLKDIKNDENIINKAKSIPDCEFKRQIIDIGLIEEKDIINTKEIFNQYEKYEKIININKAGENIINKEKNTHNNEIKTQINNKGLIEEKNNINAKEISNQNEKIFFKNEYKNIINLIYKKDYDYFGNIFGEIFVQNNKDNIELIINGKKINWFQNVF